MSPGPRVADSWFSFILLPEQRSGSRAPQIPGISLKFLDIFLMFFLLLTLHCVLADSSGPSSTVSSAGPSSPTTADTSPRFSFSDKVSLTPQSSEETHPPQSAATQLGSVIGQTGLDPPCPTVSNQIPLTPSNSPEDEAVSQDVNDKYPDPLEAPVLGQAVAFAGGGPPGAPLLDSALRLPCSELAELSLGRMEGYCPPGSLPVLLELRESSSEAGSSSQTPQSPEGPDEFFDTKESMDLWKDSPLPDTPPDPGPIQTPEHGSDHK